jgi:hypothetical protein
VINVASYLQSRTLIRRNRANHLQTRPIPLSLEVCALNIGVAQLIGGLIALSKMPGKRKKDGRSAVLKAALLGRHKRPRMPQSVAQAVTAAVRVHATDLASGDADSALPESTMGQTDTSSAGVAPMADVDLPLASTGTSSTSSAILNGARTRHDLLAPRQRLFRLRDQSTLVKQLRRQIASLRAQVARLKAASDGAGPARSLSKQEAAILTPHFRRNLIKARERLEQAPFELETHRRFFQRAAQAIANGTLPVDTVAFDLINSQLRAACLKSGNLAGMRCVFELRSGRCERPFHFPAVPSSQIFVAREVLLVVCAVAARRRCDRIARWAAVERRVRARSS